MLAFVDHDISSTLTESQSCPVLTVSVIILVLTGFHGFFLLLWNQTEPNYTLSNEIKQKLRKKRLTTRAGTWSGLKDHIWVVFCLRMSLSAKPFVLKCSPPTAFKSISELQLLVYVFFFFWYIFYSL